MKFLRTAATVASTLALLAASATAHAQLTLREAGNSWTFDIVYTKTNGRTLVHRIGTHWGTDTQLVDMVWEAPVVSKYSYEGTYRGRVMNTVHLQDGTVWASGTYAPTFSAARYGSAVQHAVNTTYYRINDDVRHMHSTGSSQEWTGIYDDAQVVVIKNDGSMWEMSHGEQASAKVTWTKLGDGFAWAYYDTNGGYPKNSSYLYAAKESDGKFYSRWKADFGKVLNVSSKTLPSRAVQQGLTWATAIAKRKERTLIFLKSGDVLRDWAEVAGTPDDTVDYYGFAYSTDAIALKANGELLVKGNTCQFGLACPSTATTWTPLATGVTSFVYTSNALFFTKNDQKIYFSGQLGSQYLGDSNRNVPYGVAGIVVPKEKVEELVSSNRSWKTKEPVPVHTLTDAIDKFKIAATDGLLGFNNSPIHVDFEHAPGASVYTLYAGLNEDGSDKFAVSSKVNPLSNDNFNFNYNPAYYGCSAIGAFLPTKGTSCATGEALTSMMTGENDGRKVYFWIEAKSADGAAIQTVSDTGYSNAAIAAVKLDIVGTYNGSGRGRPTITDGNIKWGTHDTFAFEVLSPPARAGSVVKATDDDVFTFTPNVDWTGTDEFVVKVTDKAGRSTLHFGTVKVDCPPPTIKGMRSAPKPAFKNGRVIITYDAPACSKNLGIAVMLKDGTIDMGNLVPTDAGLNQLPTGTDREISINFSNLASREYRAKVIMGDSVWKTSTDRDFPFVLVDPTKTDFQLKSENWSPRAYLDSMLIKHDNYGDPFCRLTTVEQDARNSIGEGLTYKCLLEWVSLPGGLAQVNGVTEPQLAGIPTAEGEQKIDFKISLFRDNGEKHTFKEASKVFTAPRPPAPTQTLTPTTGTPVFAFPSNGGSMARVLVDSMSAGVVTKYKIDDGEMQEFATMKGRVDRTIDAKSAPLWSKHTLYMRTYYVNKPTIYSEETVDVLTAPSEKIKVAMTAPLTALDNAVTPITVKVGIPSGPVMNYDPALHGEWKVYLAKSGAEGELVPLTKPVLASNGVAMLEAPAFNSMLAQKITAVAEVISPLEGFTKKIVADPKVIGMAKGSPLIGEIVASRKSAPAPAMMTLSVKMATKEDAAAMRSADFMVSTDNGATWAKYSKPEEAAGGRMIRSFPNGSYKVKAVFTNKNNGVTSESEPVTLVAYQMPKMVIEGATTAFPGTPIVLQAKFEDTVQAASAGAGNVDDTPVVEWEVEGKPEKVTSTSLSLESVEKGLVRIVARARSAAADPADPASWTTQKLTAKFLDIGAPKVTITGPATVEVGKTYNYKAVVTEPWAPAKAVHEINGEWILPNGAKVPGFDLTWTPTDADIATEKQPIAFRAWVNGYDDKGAQQYAESRVTVWKYVWPTFELKVVQDTTYAPSIVKLDVVATDRKLLGQYRNERLDLAYSFPPGAEIMKHKGSQAQLRLSTEGTFPVSVTVSDGRGNTTTLTENLMALVAQPFVISTKLSPSNALWRAPVSVVAKPSAAGGHPFDRAATYDFKLNGAPVESKAGVGRFTLEAPGEHSLDVTLTSRFGAVQTVTVPITVVPNQPPTCDITNKVSTTTRTMTITGVCTDADGKVIGYRWSVDGVQMGSTTNKITYPIADVGGSINVTMEATDDSRAVTTVNKMITF